MKIIWSQKYLRPSWGCGRQRQGQDAGGGWQLGAGGVACPWLGPLAESWNWAWAWAWAWILNTEPGQLECLLWLAVTLSCWLSQLAKPKENAFWPRGRIVAMIPAVFRVPRELAKCWNGDMVVATKCRCKWIITDGNYAHLFYAAK